MRPHSHQRPFLSQRTSCCLARSRRTFRRERNVQCVLRSAGALLLCKCFCTVFLRLARPRRKTRQRERDCAWCFEVCKRASSSRHVLLFCLAFPGRTEMKDEPWGERSAVCFKFSRRASSWHALMAYLSILLTSHVSQGCRACSVRTQRFVRWVCSAHTQE